MMLRPQCPDAHHPALAWVTRSLVAALRTVKDAQRGFPVLRGGRLRDRPRRLSINEIGGVDGTRTRDPRRDRPVF